MSMGEDCFFARPLGLWVAVDATPEYVRSVRFIRADNGALKNKITMNVAHDLSRYFHGDIVDFSSYRVDMTGFTPFEQNVLTSTRSIGWGIRTTYFNLAGMIERPGAWRAVGNALGKNRTPVIIPCHRIVASRGIGGYSQGIDLKFKLLKLESCMDYPG